MGFTKTRSGPTLPEYANGIRGVRAKLVSITSRVARAEREAVKTYTPVGSEEGSGLLLKGMLEQDYVAGEHANIAPVNRSEWRTDQQAPEGTIREFAQGFSALLSHRPAPGHPMGKMSWHALSPEQKQLLRHWRLGGRSSMGGPYPPPVYFGAINEGKVPGVTANIGFADQIVNELNFRVRDIISEVLG